MSDENFASLNEIELKKIKQYYFFDYDNLNYAYETYTKLIDTIKNNTSEISSNCNSEVLKEKLEKYKNEFKGIYDTIINSTDLKKDEFKEYSDLLILISVRTTLTLADYFIKNNSKGNYNKQITFNNKNYKLKELIDINSFIINYLNPNDEYHRLSLLFSNAFEPICYISIFISSFSLITSILFLIKKIVENLSIVLIAILICVIMFGIPLITTVFMGKYIMNMPNVEYLYIKNECFRIKDIVEGSIPYKKPNFFEKIERLKNILSK